MTQPAIEIEGVSKRFGDTRAVDNVVLSGEPDLDGRFTTTCPRAVVGPQNPSAAAGRHRSTVNAPLPARYSDGA